MARGLPARTAAALQCFALDLAEFGEAIRKAQASVERILGPAAQCAASFEISALDEIEKLDDAERNIGEEGRRDG